MAKGGGGLPSEGTPLKRSRAPKPTGLNALCKMGHHDLCKGKVLLHPKPGKWDQARCTCPCHKGRSRPENYRYTETGRSSP